MSITFLSIVPQKGFEPLRLSAPNFMSGLSTNSITEAITMYVNVISIEILARFSKKLFMTKINQSTASQNQCTVFQMKPYLRLSTDRRWRTSRRTAMRLNSHVVILL